MQRWRGMDERVSHEIMDYLCDVRKMEIEDLKEVWKVVPREGTLEEAIEKIKARKPTYTQILNALRDRAFTPGYPHALHVLESLIGETLITDEEFEIFRDQSILCHRNREDIPSLDTFIETKLKEKGFL